MIGKKILSNQFVLGLISVVVFWQGMHYLLHTHTFPSPFATIHIIWELKGALLIHASASCARIFIALLISCVIGIPIGLLLGKSKKMNKLLSPFFYFIYPIPKVAFLPVFMLLYGLGNISKIILIIWIIIFQIILSVRDGVLQIPDTYYKVMKGYHSSSIQQVRFLLIPAILPAIFSGVRISMGISLATLFFAENYATTYGIGYFILSAWTKMNYVEMFAGITVLGIVGLVLFMILDRLEVIFTPWLKKE